MSAGRARWAARASVFLPAAAVLALAAFPFVAPDALYLQTVLIFTFLLTVTASGWNIISGYTGYVSLGQSAFLGVGAYTVAILSQHTTVSPLLLAPLGGLGAAAVALVLGGVAMRTRGPAFVIITIALLFGMQSLALNLPDLTGGSNGLTLPLPTWSPDLADQPFYYTLLGLAVLSVALSAWVRRTKLGKGLLAIREDEDKAAAIGIRTPAYKLLGFLASAVLIGVAGGVYAYYLAFIDPRGMFDILVSVQIVLAVLLGGRGTLWGPVLGAFLVQPLIETTNTYFGSTSGLRLVIFGGLLGAVVVVMPHGLLPTVRGWLERRYARPVPVAERAERAAAAPTTATSATTTTTTANATGADPTGPTANATDRGTSPRVLLEVREVSKRFGGLTALDGCSFTVAEGSITGLIGPNGSGKTTVFNVVSGMTRASGGEVLLDGRRIDGMPPWRRPALGVGRTFQITRLFGQLTVLENVVAPLGRFSWRQLAADGVSGREARRARELLGVVGLGGLAEQRTAALSFGQQKLVELAQVLMLRPRLVLLDEPAGGINPALVEHLAALMRELNREGITFLVVEHNMPMVLDLCDPVVVLARGRCIASGPPSAVRTDPAVLDAYLGGEDPLAEPLEV